MVELARIAYHHGHLRAALVDAALDLTRTRGASALVLREVTRRVGVSPNAAYRHFADRDALLQVVSARIQHEMAQEMSSRTAAAGVDVGARQILRAVGLGYIGFALREPGWFDVVFRVIDPGPLHRSPEPDVDLAGPEPPLAPPLAQLVNALDRLVLTGELAADARAGAEWPCWSAVHGFAVLALHGPLRGMPAEDVWAAAERTVDAVIEGVLS